MRPKIFPLRSVTGSDDVIRSGNYVVIAKLMPSWISGLDHFPEQGFYNELKT